MAKNQLSKPKPKPKIYPCKSGENDGTITIQIEGHAKQALKFPLKAFRWIFESEIQRKRADRKMIKETVELLKKAGCDPEVIYAFKKLGFLVNEEDLWVSKEEVVAWDEAIREYFKLVAKGMTPKI